ncbi:hypothetical protein RclHR1_05740009 [Rhizophagus clarus]|uniref:MYND-type domain-containing protein n=1 Tax=Rhizophagus clarus TaxID=94130 RepID=A0A2Z6SG82_9GLOM|nr:hypothetical protein RclHR1_05740009 [Rhizophagus clarus]GES99074.1 hypothetical protein GLOIN_2v1712121 [Rhizophagus clarus]
MECSVCKKTTIKRCSRCHTKYYCSSSCQKKDYPNHVLDCPSRSADILVKNVVADIITTNDAVRYEYGFCNCKNPAEESNLLGLYTGLIKYIDCSASELHSWWKSGNFPLHIKKACEDKGYKSYYYQWFLKNEHVLQNLRKYEGEKTDKYLADKYHEMVKPYLSKHDQTIPMKSLSESFPESKQSVYALYLIMLTGCIPRIEQQTWIDFGFCSCKYGNDYLGQTEEIRLGDLYRELIIQKGCKIDEFHDAYLSGSILDLLKRRKCNRNDYNWLLESKIEIRGYHQPIKSVYYLKQYALSDVAALKRSVNLDYGFMNCRTEDEKRQLKNTYRKLIKNPKFDPRDLHEACITGKIFNYVGSILPDEALKAKFFKNPYPLKDI